MLPQNNVLVVRLIFYSPLPRYYGIHLPVKPQCVFWNSNHTLTKVVLSSERVCPAGRHSSAQTSNPFHEGFNNAALSIIMITGGFDSINSVLPTFRRRTVTRVFFTSGRGSTSRYRFPWRWVSTCNRFWFNFLGMGLGLIL